MKVDHESMGGINIGFELFCELLVSLSESTKRLPFAVVLQKSSPYFHRLGPLLLGTLVAQAFPPRLPCNIPVYGLAALS